MKISNSKSFFAGIVLTTLLFLTYSFSSTPKENIHKSTVISIAQSASITPEQAANYKNNYKASNPDKVSAINLSIEQWEAVNQTLAQRGGSNGVSGFRLYFGNTKRDGSGDLVSIPYVLNQSLEEEPPMNQIPMARDFDSNYNSQCPPFCD